MRWKATKSFTTIANEAIKITCVYCNFSRQELGKLLHTKVRCRERTFADTEMKGVIGN